MIRVGDLVKMVALRTGDVAEAGVVTRVEQEGAIVWVLVDSADQSSPHYATELRRAVRCAVCRRVEYADLARVVGSRTFCEHCWEKGTDEVRSWTEVPE